MEHRRETKRGQTNLIDRHVLLLPPPEALRVNLLLLSSPAPLHHEHHTRPIARSRGLHDGRSLSLCLLGVAVDEAVEEVDEGVEIEV